MRNILTIIAGWASQISEKFNFGQHGSVATMILLIIIGFVLILGVVKFVKKKVGNFIAILLIIAILIGTGFLSLSQLKNFAESAGMIYTEGFPEATEEDGKWIIEFFENLAPGKEEGAGTWVPDKYNPDEW